MSGMPGQAEPWQNRASILSVWNESVAGFDGSGAGIASLPMSKDGIITQQVPVCVPRACRLTRVCAVFLYADDVPGNPVINFFYSTNCGAGFSSVSVTVPEGLSGFALNCFCGDINVMLNECDIWYSNVTLPNHVLPLWRILFHFELR